MECTELDKGQRLALERLSDDLSLLKKSVCIIAEHDCYDCEQDIDVANAIVTEYRWKSKWWNETNNNGIGITTREFVASFIKLIEGGNNQ